MDEKKENEDQTELESSADANSVSGDEEGDRESGSLDDTQKEPESEPSKIAPESPDDPSEDESGSETADEIKTEKKAMGPSPMMRRIMKTLSRRRKLMNLMKLRSLLPPRHQAKMKRRIQPKKSKLIPIMTARRGIRLNNCRTTLKGKQKTYPN